MEVTCGEASAVWYNETQTRVERFRSNGSGGSDLAISSLLLGMESDGKTLIQVREAQYAPGFWSTFVELGTSALGPT